jgi:hypothetical protein
MFAAHKHAAKEDRLYIQVKDLIFSDNGIFFSRENKIYPVKVVAYDENGLYVIKGWFSSDKDDDNDEPRGSHSNNQQESNRERHQKANARRKREQEAADRRREEAKRRGQKRKGAELNQFEIYSKR